MSQIQQTDTDLCTSSTWHSHWTLLFCQSDGVYKPTISLLDLWQVNPSGIFHLQLYVLCSGIQSSLCSQYQSTHIKTYVQLNVLTLYMCCNILCQWYFTQFSLKTEGWLCDKIKNCPNLWQTNRTLGQQNFYCTTQQTESHMIDPNCWIIEPSAVQTLPHQCCQLPCNSNRQW